MQLFRKIRSNFPPVCLLLINLFLLDSCASSSPANSNAVNQTTNTNAKNSSAASDDIAALAALVRLPEIPEEVVWREEVLENREASDQNSKGKKLTAVLKYNDADAEKIVALAEKSKTAEKTEIGTEDWFPEELTAQTQLSASESLKGTAYGANDFFNAPYSNGKLTRIEGTNYFVLELTSF